MNARLLIAASALVLGTACDAEGNLDLEPYVPSVAFKELRVDTVDWDGIDSQFVFTVENPNPVAIELSRFDYGLAFEGVEWLSGDDPDGLALAAADGSELALPVSLEFQSLYEMVQAIRGQDDIGFALDGSFGFDTSWGPVDLPYLADGGFPAPRKPTFTYNALQVESLSFTGADLALELDVTNEHGSNLLFKNVDYQIALAGVAVGGGFLEDLGEVEGDAVRTLRVPIAVDFRDVGSAIYDVLNGDRLRVDLQADMDVDTPFGLVPLNLEQSGTVNIRR